MTSQSADYRYQKDQHVANTSPLINGGVQNNNGKGVGISNELKFAASGELDNGYSWNYHMELDPNGGGTTDADDSALTIYTNGMGTVGIFDSEGGLSTELGWGIGALGTGQDYANTMTRIGMGSDVSAEAHVAYYTPAGLLPFGIEAAAGMGAKIQSLRRRCPVSHEGGAGKTSHESSRPWNKGSQLMNETRPIVRSHDIIHQPPCVNGGVQVLLVVCILQSECMLYFFELVSNPNQ